MILSLVKGIVLAFIKLLMTVNTLKMSFFNFFSKLIF